MKKCRLSMALIGLCLVSLVMLTACTPDVSGTTAYAPHDHKYEEGYCTVCGSEFGATTVNFFSFKLKADDTYRIDVAAKATLPAHVVIPSAYNGKPVTSIHNYAFQGCTNLQSVKLPASIQTIGQWAFRDCVNLTTITFMGNKTTPATLSNIGDGAFYNCAKLSAVELPSSVLTLGEYTFSRCTSLAKVTLPQNLKTISKSLFEGCTSLSEVTIPDGVKTIGDSAFRKCEALIEVNVPDRVFFIDCHAFQDCTALTQVSLPLALTQQLPNTPPENPNDKEAAANYELYKNKTNIDVSAFDGCPNLTTVTFRGTVAEWESVEKGYRWNYQSLPFVVVCTDGEISE
ncbi:MAG: leucine-rich repeat protein [Clostridia bacterium]|nr:leucine-rich repeat protein [Clostridia bacterium]